MADTLLLASGSYARQMLLKEIQIPFVIIAQHADESQCDWGLPLPQVVAAIARYKMAHAIMPRGDCEGAVCYVLTADSLCMDKEGNLLGKPTDYADAVAKIKASRGGARAGTAFCLDKKMWRNGTWELDQRIERYVEAAYIFDVPDNWIEKYIEQSRCLQTAGAVVIEGYGQQFLRHVDGSYSTIMGLPLCELRETLELVGFKL